MGTRHRLLPFQRKKPTRSQGFCSIRLKEGSWMTSYDVVVIGGGAGGLVRAKEARRRGARVVIVQDGPLGGASASTPNPVNPSLPRMYSQQSAERRQDAGSAWRRSGS